MSKIRCYFEFKAIKFEWKIHNKGNDNCCYAPAVIAFPISYVNGTHHTSNFIFMYILVQVGINMHLYIQGLLFLQDSPKKSLLNFLGRTNEDLPCAVYSDI